MELKAELPSQRGETWNDTEAIACHRAMTPSQRLALAVDVSRAALMVAASARRMKDPRFAPELIGAGLNASGVAYVMVGGLALAAHGVVRASDDLDLVPEPTADNRDRLVAVLVGLGASIDATPAGPGLLRFRTRHGAIHVLDRVAGVPPYAELMARAVTLYLAGSPIRCCSLGDLRAMKLATGRPRDLVDVCELDELNGR